MSFRHYKYAKPNTNELQRKESDSFLAHHFKKNSRTLRERASVFTPRGSITLEAALSVSVFFLATLCLVYLFEIMALQTGIKSALHAVAKEVAVETYVSPVIPTTKMEKRMAQLLDRKWLHTDLLVGGSGGLDCSQSKKYWNTTIMDLQVQYKIEIPIAMFRIPIIERTESIRVKGWTGHEVKTADSVENTMVYVTEYGIVYHADMECSYLELSVKPIEETTVGEIRNQNGEKYGKCSYCSNASGQSAKVYVTDYGDKYHKSLECSKIKRNIYAISIDDVYGLGGCSKCVK